MSLLGGALVELRARWVRYLGLCLLLGCIIALVVSLIVLSRAIQDNVGDAAYERGVELVVRQKGSAEFLTSSLTRAQFESVRSVEGVRSAEAELVLFAAADTRGQVLAFGWEPDSRLWQRMPPRGHPAPGEGEAIAGAELAKALGLKTGDSLDLYGEPVRIAGIASYHSMINSGALFLRLDFLQKIALREGQLNFIYVSLSSDEVLARRATEQLASMPAVTVSDVRTGIGEDRNFQFFLAVSQAISVVSTAIGALCVFMIMMMTVRERRHDIAVLASLGWSPLRIAAAISIESVLIGLIAGALSLPLIFLVAAAFRWLPGIGEIVQFQPGFLLCVGTIGLSICLAVCGAVLPGLSAARVPPAEVLRSIS